MNKKKKRGSTQNDGATCVRIKRITATRKDHKILFLSIIDPLAAQNDAAAYQRRRHTK